MKIAILVALCVVGVLGFPERRQVPSHCNTFCPMYIIELCGSDGKTYHSNECFLKSQFCTEGRNDYDSFHALHFGACTGNELSETTTEAATTTSAPNGST